MVDLQKYRFLPSLEQPAGPSGPAAGRGTGEAGSFLARVLSRRLGALLGFLLALALLQFRGSGHKASVRLESAFCSPVSYSVSLYDTLIYSMHEPLVNSIYFQSQKYLIPIRDTKLKSMQRQKCRSGDN